jgi:Excalibur calcium-binding domain
MKILFVLSVLSLAACSPAAFEDRIPEDGYAALSNDQLWNIQSSTSSPNALLAVEAELGARGQTRSGGSFLGQRTVGTVGRTSYARAPSTTSDRDCSEFRSAGDAQKYFIEQGGPISDPSNLDGDGDGNACEWGRELRRSYAAASPPRQTVRPQSTGSRCYRGPRGGTYTITSGGNRNYDGC